MAGIEKRLDQIEQKAATDSPYEVFRFDVEGNLQARSGETLEETRAAYEAAQESEGRVPVRVETAPPPGRVEPESTENPS